MKVDGSDVYNTTLLPSTTSSAPVVDSPHTECTNKAHESFDLAVSASLEVKQEAMCVEEAENHNIDNLTRNLNCAIGQRDSLESEDIKIKDDNHVCIFIHYNLYNILTE